MWCVNMKARLTRKRTSMTMSMIKENFHLTHTKQQINCEAFAFSLDFFYDSSFKNYLIQWQCVWLCNRSRVLCRSLETSNTDKSLKSCSVIKIPSSEQSSGKSSERKENKAGQVFVSLWGITLKHAQLFNINWKIIYLWAFITACQC